MGALSNNYVEATLDDARDFTVRCETGINLGEKPAHFTIRHEVACWKPERAFYKVSSTSPIPWTFKVK